VVQVWFSHRSTSMYHKGTQIWDKTMSIKCSDNQVVSPATSTNSMAPLPMMGPSSAPGSPLSPASFHVLPMPPPPLQLNATASSPSTARNSHVGKLKITSTHSGSTDQSVTLFFDTADSLEEWRANLVSIAARFIGDPC